MAIKRRGRAAPLQMPKHATARFLSSALRNLARDNFADSSKSKFALLGLAFYLLTIFGSCGLLLQQPDEPRLPAASRALIAAAIRS
jgi:hypothetical protein